MRPLFRQRITIELSIGFDQGGQAGAAPC
jgi:hypothetical protein